jgi:hypothetical protein
MSKPLCMIVGIDGFDPDVLANLAAFYGGCGYSVRISRRPRDCELLVLQRGPYSGQVFDERASACHIYDYAALGTSDFHRAFPNIGACVVIAPSGGASGIHAPPRQVGGIHPVVPALWRANSRSRPRRASYDYVHIGHRKPNPGGDSFLLQMDAVAAGGRCHFWGKGWPAPGRTVHGPASLHESQQIYRRSSFALGVMYPFQRGRTISGRMWQAPLNGCMLLSEAVAPGASFPGVERCTDFMSALDEPRRAPDAASLIEEACAFWGDATMRLAGALGLKYSAPSVVAIGATYLKWVYARHIENRVMPSGETSTRLKAFLRKAI